METKPRFRGDRLREARKGRGLSQGALASRIGAHFTSVSDWERGSNAPSGRHVASLCRELGVSAEQLYEEDEEEAAQLGYPLVDDLARSFVRAFRDELAASSRHRSPEEWDEARNLL